MEQNGLNVVIEQCKRGNQESFRALVMEYQNIVFSLTLKMLCDEEEAKDAVQNTFVLVWKNLEKYDAGKGKFSTWVYTIASRVCLEYLKSRKKIYPIPDNETVFRQYISNENDERQLMNREWAAIVKVLAARLSPKQQLVFTLSILENRDTEEIKTITGLSADKIKSNLYVARQKIKEQLNQLGYGQD